MNRICVVMAVGVLLASSAAALGLSLQLDQPTIHFPKDYDQPTADAIHAVLNKKELKFAHGLYSHWPPQWSTTLVYEGDTQALQQCLEELSRIEGLRVRVTLSRDLSRETGSALAAGTWWVNYSHETPNVITVRVNLASPQVDLDQLEFWASGPVRRC